MQLMIKILVFPFDFNVFHFPLLVMIHDGLGSAVSSLPLIAVKNMCGLCSTEFRHGQNSYCAGPSYNISRSNGIQNNSGTTKHHGNVLHSYHSIDCHCHDRGCWKADCHGFPILTSKRHLHCHGNHARGCDTARFRQTAENGHIQPSRSFRPNPTPLYVTCAALKSSHNIKIHKLIT